MAKNTSKVRIGLDKLYIAKLITDTESTISYETPYAVPGLIKITITPNVSTETLYTDNKPSISYSVVGTVDVEIEKDSLPDDLLTELLGYAESGATKYRTSTYNAPYVAIMFRQLYDNGTYSYVKLFKGRFSEPESSNETKNDSVNFQTGTIKAQFVATNYVKNFGNGRQENIIMATADEESDGYAGEGTTWFTYVIEAAPAFAITSSVADAATDVSKTAAITLTSTNAINSGYVTANNVFLLKDGVGKIATSLTLDNTYKIVTITPSEALTGTAQYTLVYSLADIYGQTTDTVVINFTTAA